jgi:hypothetical protein
MKLPANLKLFYFGCRVEETFLNGARRILSL